MGFRKIVHPSTTHFGAPLKKGTHHERIAQLPFNFRRCCFWYHRSAFQHSYRFGELSNRIGRHDHTHGAGSSRKRYVNRGVGDGRLIATWRFIGQYLRRKNGLFTRLSPEKWAFFCVPMHSGVAAEKPQKDNKMNAPNNLQDGQQEEIPAQYCQTIFWNWFGAVRAKLIAVLVATSCTFGTVQAASNISNGVTSSNSEVSGLHSGASPSEIPMLASPNGVVAPANIPANDFRHRADLLAAEAPPAPLDPAPMPLVLLSLGFAAITYSRAPQHPPKKPLYVAR